MQLTYKKLTNDLGSTIADIFNDCFDFSYKVNEALVAKKLFNADDYFGGGSFICYDDNIPVGFIACKLSLNILPEYKDTGFISLFAVKRDYQSKGIGTKLLSSAKEAFIKENAKKILVSQDLNNFFAGIPEPTAKSVSFFRKQGFTVNQAVHWDLCNDLSENDLGQYKSLVNLTADYKTVCADKSDIPAISEFMKKEFPGRWDFEVSQTFTDGSLGHILLLKRGDAIKGFCRVRCGSDTNGNEFYLGSDCGALGPIGISRDIRKQGLGLRILFDALCFLKDSGAHKTNIDWTSLKDFYGILGFEPWRTYLGAFIKL